MLSIIWLVCPTGQVRHTSSPSVIVCYIFFFYYHHHLALSLQVYLTFIVLDYQMHHPVCLFASYMFHVFNRLRKWKTTSEPDFLLISSLVQLSCNATL